MSASAEARLENISRAATDSRCITYTSGDAVLLCTRGEGWPTSAGETGALADIY